MDPKHLCKTPDISRSLFDYRSPIPSIMEEKEESPGQIDTPPDQNMQNLQTPPSKRSKDFTGYSNHSKSSLSEWLLNSSQKKPHRLEQVDLSALSKSLMTDVKKLKVLTVFTIVLEEKLKIHALIQYKSFFESLKSLNQDLNMKKFGFLKLSGLINTKQKELKRTFLSAFTEQFAKKFKNYMKGILTNVKKTRMSRSNSQSKPEKPPKLSLVVSKMLKLTRDLINDHKAEDFKVSSKDLNLLLILQRGFNLLAFQYNYQRKQNLQTAFQTILKRTVQTIPEDDITGIKDISHYSIILHPAPDQKSNKPKTKLLKTPTKHNKSHIDNLLNISQSSSPIPVHMLSQQVIRVGEVSGQDLSSYYESSINISPEKRIEKFHTKLKNLSLILNKKLPSMKSRHLHKFLQYDQALFQVFRISENSILREKLIAFQKIETHVTKRKAIMKILNNLLNLAKRFRSNLLLKSLLRWKDGGNGNKNDQSQFVKTEEVMKKQEKRRDFMRELQRIALIFKKRMGISFEKIRDFLDLKKIIIQNKEKLEKQKIFGFVQVLKSLFLRKKYYGLRKIVAFSDSKIQGENNAQNIIKNKAINSLILTVKFSTIRRISTTFKKINSTSEHTTSIMHASIQKFKQIPAQIKTKSIKLLTKAFHLAHNLKTSPTHARKELSLHFISKSFKSHLKLQKKEVFALIRFFRRKSLSKGLKPLILLINSMVKTRSNNVFQQLKRKSFKELPEKAKSISEGLSTIEKILASKEKLLMKDSFFSLIIHEHREAFENQGKFLRFLRIFKKSYLLKIFWGFSALKVHLNMGYLEFLISKRIFSQEKIEREKYVETLITKIERQHLSETQIINVLRGAFESEPLNLNLEDWKNDAINEKESKSSKGIKGNFEENELDRRDSSRRGEKSLRSRPKFENAADTNLRDNLNEVKIEPKKRDISSGKPNQNSEIPDFNKTSSQGKKNEKSNQVFKTEDAELAKINESKADLAKKNETKTDLAKENEKKIKVHLARNNESKPPGKIGQFTTDQIDENPFERNVADRRNDQKKGEKLLKGKISQIPDQKELPSNEEKVTAKIVHSGNEGIDENPYDENMLEERSGPKRGETSLKSKSSQSTCNHDEKTPLQTKAGLEKNSKHNATGSKINEKIDPKTSNNVFENPFEENMLDGSNIQKRGEKSLKSKVSQSNPDEKLHVPTTEVDVEKNSKPNEKKKPDEKPPIQTKVDVEKNSKLNESKLPEKTDQMRNKQKAESSFEENMDDGRTNQNREEKSLKYKNSQNNDEKPPLQMKETLRLPENTDQKTNKPRVENQIEENALDGRTNQKTGEKSLKSKSFKREPEEKPHILTDFYENGNEEQEDPQLLKKDESDGGKSEKTLRSKSTKTEPTPAKFEEIIERSRDELGNEEPFSKIHIKSPPLQKSKTPVEKSNPIGNETKLIEEPPQGNKKRDITKDKSQTTNPKKNQEQQPNKKPLDTGKRNESPVLFDEKVNIWENDGSNKFEDPKKDLINDENSVKTKPNLANPRNEELKRNDRGKIIKHEETLPNDKISNNKNVSSKGLLFQPSETQMATVNLHDTFIRNEESKDETPNESSNQPDSTKSKHSHKTEAPIQKNNPLETTTDKNNIKIPNKHETFDKIDVKLKPNPSLDSKKDKGKNNYKGPEPLTIEEETTEEKPTNTRQQSLKKTMSLPSPQKLHLHQKMEQPEEKPEPQTLSEIPQDFSHPGENKSMKFLEIPKPERKPKPKVSQISNELPRKTNETTNYENKSKNIGEKPKLLPENSKDLTEIKQKNNELSNENTDPTHRNVYPTENPSVPSQDDVSNQEQPPRNQPFDDFTMERNKNQSGLYQNLRSKPIISKEKTQEQDPSNNILPKEFDEIHSNQEQPPRNQPFDDFTMERNKIQRGLDQNLRSKPKLSQEKTQEQNLRNNSLPKDFDEIPERSNEFTPNTHNSTKNVMASVKLPPESHEKSEQMITSNPVTESFPFQRPETDLDEIIKQCSEILRQNNNQGPSKAPTNNPTTTNQTSNVLPTKNVYLGQTRSEGLPENFNFKKNNAHNVSDSSMKSSNKVELPSERSIKPFKEPIGFFDKISGPTSEIRIRTENTENVNDEDEQISLNYMNDDQGPFARNYDFGLQEQLLESRPNFKKKSIGVESEKEKANSQNGGQRETLSISSMNNKIEVGRGDDPGIKAYFEVVCPGEITNISRKYSDMKSIEFMGTSGLPPREMRESQNRPFSNEDLLKCKGNEETDQNSRKKGKYPEGAQDDRYPNKDGARNHEHIRENMQLRPQISSDHINDDRKEQPPNFTEGGLEFNEDGKKERDKKRLVKPPGETKKDQLPTYFVEGGMEIDEKRVAKPGEDYKGQHHSCVIEEGQPLEEKKDQQPCFTEGEMEFDEAGRKDREKKRNLKPFEEKNDQKPYLMEGGMEMKEDQRKDEDTKRVVKPGENKNNQLVYINERGKPGEDKKDQQPFFMEGRLGFNEDFRDQKEKKTVVKPGEEKKDQQPYFTEGGMEFDEDNRKENDKKRRLKPENLRLDALSPEQDRKTQPQNVIYAEEIPENEDDMKEKFNRRNKTPENTTANPFDQQISEELFEKVNRFLAQELEKELEKQNKTMPLPDRSKAYPDFSKDPIPNSYLTPKEIKDYRQPSNPREIPQTISLKIPSNYQPNPFKESPNKSSINTQSHPFSVNQSAPTDLHFKSVGQTSRFPGDSTRRPFEIIQEEEYFPSGRDSERGKSLFPSSRPIIQDSRTENIPPKYLSCNPKSPNKYQSSYENLFYNPTPSDSQNRFYKQSYNKPIVPNDNQASRDAMLGGSFDEGEIPCKSLNPIHYYEEEEQKPLQKHQKEDYDFFQNNKKKLEGKLRGDKPSENEKTHTEGKKDKKPEINELFDEILAQRFESLKKGREKSFEFSYKYKKETMIREETVEENYINCEFCGSNFVQDDSFFRNLLDTTDVGIPQKTLNAEFLVEEGDYLPDRTLNMEF